MKDLYTSVRGTSNFSPNQTHLFNKIVEIARGLFRLFGYQEINLPILENEAVFIRGVGQLTDIVEKQMFYVNRQGKNEDQQESKIVLRPEGTAQVARYFVENSLHKQSDFYKFCYFGAMFRGERPQKGRLRQFHHIAAEAIGSNSEFLDAEVIFLSLKILEEVGIKEKTLHLNSLGCSHDKEKFKQLLKNDLIKYREQLCQDCKRRIEKNPLRVFDCKENVCKDITQRFSFIDKEKYLCNSCLEHFQKVVEILKNIFKIEVFIDSRLVRGLDYYTNTIFEITSSSLGAQNALGGGGRYNNLIEQLGGPKIPAVGFALGVERIMLALGNFEDKIKTTNVFVATTSSSLVSYVAKITKELRDSRIASDMDYSDKSLKAQLRVAEKKEVDYVVIVGESELKEGKVILKDMKNSLQEMVDIDNIVRVLKSKLNYA